MSSYDEFVDYLDCADDDYNDGEYDDESASYYTSDDGYANESFSENDHSADDHAGSTFSTEDSRSDERHVKSHDFASNAQHIDSRGRAPSRCTNTSRSQSSMRIIEQHTTWSRDLKIDLGDRDRLDERYGTTASSTHRSHMHEEYETDSTHWRHHTAAASPRSPNVPQPQTSPTPSRPAARTLMFVQQTPILSDLR